MFLVILPLPLYIGEFLAWFEISAFILVLALGFWYQNRQYWSFIGCFAILVSS